MKECLYPTMDEVLDLHERLIKRYGGGEGVRDQGLVESALIRPQMGYYNSLSLQAATYLESFCLNHPFVDGNKRVAFAIMVIFLKMNGYDFRCSQKEAYDFIVRKLIQEKISLEASAKWIESKLQTR